MNLYQLGNGEQEMNLRRLVGNMRAHRQDLDDHRIARNMRAHRQDLDDHRIAISPAKEDQIKFIAKKS